MSKSLKFGVACVAAVAFSAGPLIAGPFGLGRTASPDEIAAWDKDIRPDGVGLPVGSGSVEDGENIFADTCASCHGDFAEGVGNWPKLAGGAGTLADEDPLKTVGSYWPYLSTTWDYVNRSMPFGDAQSLSSDEVYAIVAYILYSNDLVEDDFVLSQENFLDVEMPNAGGFILDDRGVSEHPAFSQEPCMADCKASVEITKRATVLDVTPQETSVTSAADTGIVAQSTSSEVTAQPPEPVSAKGDVSDPALVAAGEKMFKKCKACHQVGASAKNKTGPLLNGVVGRTAAAFEGFKYSKSFISAGDGGLVWNNETLSEFLTKPKSLIKGTKMSFSGLKKQSDIDALVAYLGTFTD
jgi:S-disulfanyl-L-cysteine oxidoreductase SoxD